ncbi:glutathione-dependent formaldehyde-activating protein [Ilyonectria robusta]
MNSINGQCSCGSIRYSFTGEPLNVSLCYCNGCRRSSSSAFTTNILVLESNFVSTAGTPKAFKRKGGSGNEGSEHFCPDCGAQLYVTSNAAPGIVIIKAGTLDDWRLNDTKFKPTVEIFCQYKYNWLPDIGGTTKFEGAMPTGA